MPQDDPILDRPCLGNGCEIRFSRHQIADISAKTGIKVKIYGLSFRVEEKPVQSCRFCGNNRADRLRVRFVSFAEFTECSAVELASV